MKGLLLFIATLLVLPWVIPVVAWYAHKVWDLLDSLKRSL